MTIEYDLTAEDYVAFAAHHHSKPGAAGGSRRRLRDTFTVIYLAIFLLNVVTGLRPRDFIWLALAVLWYLFAGRLHQFFVRRGVQRIAQQGLCRGSVGAHRMVISADGITDTTPHYEWMTRWSGVEHVEQLPDRALIYVGPNAALQVPRRAFASDAAYNDFVTEVRSGIRPVVA